MGIYRCTPVCCISFDSYIKPQPATLKGETGSGCISFDSYIKPQRTAPRNSGFLSCISFDSYIKPQHRRSSFWHCPGCISFDSYIKPQHGNKWNTGSFVVYLLIPTSNHNFCISLYFCKALYIF